jgi:hypothetical protein
MDQHKVDARTYRYKLEMYPKNFPNFVYGNPTSTKTSSQDEENEARPNRMAQEPRCKLRNHK